MDVENDLILDFEQHNALNTPWGTVQFNSEAQLVLTTDFAMQLNKTMGKASPILPVN